MLLASTPLLLPPPSLRWLHSCCSGRAAPQGATEWGQGRDLWDTLKVFPCVHRSAYKSHAVFPQYLSVCECVSVSVSRLAKQLTLYHVALQEARCPCTGHPRRKPIRKNRDYIWGDWPPVIPFLSLSLWNTFELPSFIFIFHSAVLDALFAHPLAILAHAVEAALQLKVYSDFCLKVKKMLRCQLLTGKCCIDHCDSNLSIPNRYVDLCGHLKCT